jgi:hypothetical protein
MKIDTFKILLGLGRHTKYNTSKLLHGSNSSIAKKKYLFWKQYDEFLEENKWLKEIEYNELVPQNWRNLNKKEPNASLPIDLYLELHMNYPVPLPYPLFIISDNSEIDRNIMDLADKWLKDIFSGESFYKLNKEYFSRSEVKQFLTCDWLEFIDEKRIYPAAYLDLIDHYFYEKIKANNLTFPNYVFTDPFKSCFTHKIVQEYFQFICNHRKHFNDEGEAEDIGEYLKSEYIDTGKELDFKGISWQNLKRNYKYYALDILNGLKYKFEHCFTHKLVQEYLKFIDNNLFYIRNKNEITDISDFLRNEYLDTGKDFDFNGRTWNGLRRLSDEWHVFQSQKDQKLFSKSWKKSTIEDFIYRKEGKVWTINEITSEKLLHDEGEEMEHCVFSYLGDCIAGRCFIFSVSRKTKKGLEERIATVEISRNLELIQARGKNNSNLSIETKNIIEKWINKNNIITYDENFDDAEQRNVVYEEYFYKILNEKNKTDGINWTLNSIEKNRKYWYYANKYGKAYSNFCKPGERSKLISLKSSNEKEIILIMSNTGSIRNCFDTEHVLESQMIKKNNILREWMESKGIYSSGLSEPNNYNDNYGNEDDFDESSDDWNEDDEDEEWDDEVDEEDDSNEEYNEEEYDDDKNYEE